MNIENERPVKIFVKEGQYGKMYSTGISKKNEDGTYTTAYIPVLLKKGYELNDGDMIYIRKAWLTPSKDLKIKIFISEYETVEETIEKSKSFESFKADEITYTDDDLPF